MAQQLLNIGAAADDGSGTKGRAGGDIINDNFTELYTYVQSAALLADGSQDGTNQSFTGHVSIGATASYSDADVLTVTENVADGTLSYGIGSVVTMTGSPLVGNTVTGYKAIINYEGTPSLVETGSAIGLDMVANHNTTADMTQVVGSQSVVGCLASAGATISLIGHKVNSLMSVTAGTVTNSIGIDIGNFSKSIVTNAHGLRIANQTGGTNNYGIMLNGDDLGSDITFGAGQDVRMHFNGTDFELEGSGITASPDATGAHDTKIRVAIDGVQYYLLAEAV